MTLSKQFTVHQWKESARDYLSIRLWRRDMLSESSWSGGGPDAVELVYREYEGTFQFGQVDRTEAHTESLADMLTLLRKLEKRTKLDTAVEVLKALRALGFKPVDRNANEGRWHLLEAFPTLPVYYIDCKTYPTVVAEDAEDAKRKLLALLSQKVANGSERFERLLTDWIQNNKPVVISGPSCPGQGWPPILYEVGFLHKDERRSA